MAAASAASAGHQVLLSTAYCQLHHGKDPAACLKCVGALRQLETPEAAAPAVALLAFQAFMVQGCLEQAEKEATGVKDCKTACSWQYATAGLTGDLPSLALQGGQQRAAGTLLVVFISCTTHYLIVPTVM